MTRKSVFRDSVSGDFDDGAPITTFPADVAGATHAATGKTTPVDADELPLVDSAASNVLKKLTWANLKATLKTYFDTLYAATGSGVTSINKTGSTALTGAVTLTGGTGMTLTQTGNDISFASSGGTGSTWSVLTNQSVPDLIFDGHGDVIMVQS